MRAYGQLEGRAVPPPDATPVVVEPDAVPRVLEPAAPVVEDPRPPLPEITRYTSVTRKRRIVVDAYRTRTVAEVMEATGLDYEEVRTILRMEGVPRRPGQRPS